MLLECHCYHHVPTAKIVRDEKILEIFTFFLETNNEEDDQKALVERMCKRLIKAEHEYAVKIF